MNDSMPNLNGFPTDNSSSTNLKYDIVASKFMTGIRNHQMRTAPAPAPTTSVVFYLIGAVLELTLGILLLVGIGLHKTWKSIKH